MNSIVERVRAVRSIKSTNNLLKQQAERIKELEAYAKHERDLGYEKGYADAEAALRKRIADAPVVAEVVRNYNVKHECYDPDGIYNRIVWSNPCEENKLLLPAGTKLISKEDLK